MSIVYFAGISKDEPQVSINEKIYRLFDKTGFKSVVSPNDLVAVKVHFGEEGNTTYIRPEFIVPIIKKIKSSRGKPFLTDTNTLYPGERTNAVEHLLLAHKHGFTIENTGAPVIISDGLVGKNEIEIGINGEFYKKVPIATEIIMANSLIVVSHPTGHLITGFGGAIKNLGMGASSRKGKLSQHSSTLPQVTESKCTKCGLCFKWCPAGAIEEKEKSMFIISSECIGCGECIAVCRRNAVRFNYNVSSDDMQKKIAEHAYGAIIEKKDKVGFFNFIINVTKDCDCMVCDQKPFIGYFGILASTDPVSIDQASIDLIEKETKRKFNELAYPKFNHNVQFIHGEEIGLGSRNYDLKIIN